MLFSLVHEGHNCKWRAELLKCLTDKFNQFGLTYCISFVFSFRVPRHFIYAMLDTIVHVCGWWWLNVYFKILFCHIFLKLLWNVNTFFQITHLSLSWNGQCSLLISYSAHNSFFFWILALISLLFLFFSPCTFSRSLADSYT